jgi:hypothetical protein
MSEDTGMAQARAAALAERIKREGEDCKAAEPLLKAWPAARKGAFALLEATRSQTGGALATRLIGQIKATDLLIEAIGQLGEAAEPGED